MLMGAATGMVAAGAGVDAKIGLTGGEAISGAGAGATFAIGAGAGAGAAEVAG
jgi:hypothetical protein